MKRLGCLAILFGLAVLAFSPAGQRFLPQITDFSKPAVQVTPGRELFGTNVSIPFEVVDVHPIRLKYYFDGNEAGAKELEAPTSPLQLETTGLTDGAHTLKLEFTDQSFWKNSTSLEVPFRLDLTPPSSELLSPQRIWESRQGDTLLVFVRTNKPIHRAELELGYKPETQQGRLRAVFFEVAPLVWCVLRPIDIETPPGTYTDRIFLLDEAGNETQSVQQTTVLKKPLKDGDVQLTENILAKLGVRTLEEQEEMRSKNNKRVSEITSVFSPDRHFRGPFIRPAQGTWTSPYGQNRLYNSKVWHRHLGMDLADVATAPVFAANDGKVAMAENLGIYGHCVILDHGRGIFTLYGHNSALKVKAGDMVKKGDTIAIQGDSGLAGGIHLHLSMIVGSVYVAPDIFIQKFEGFEKDLASALGPAAAAPTPAP